MFHPGRVRARTVLDLAQHYGYGPIALKQIARRQEVSEHYLEQLMGGLRKRGWSPACAAPKEGTGWPCRRRNYGRRRVAGA